MGLKQMSFRTVRNLGLAAMLLIVLMVSALSYFVMSGNAQKLETIIGTENEKIRQWHTLSELISDCRGNLYEYTKGNGEHIAPIYGLINRALNKVDEIRRRTHRDDELTYIKRLEEGVNRFKQAAHGYRAEIEEGYRGGTSALEMEAAAGTAAERIIQLSREAENNISSRIERDNRNILATTKLSKKILAIIFGIAIFSTLLIALFMNRALSRPIENLVNASHHIAEGDFSKRVEIISEDEVGMLGKSFNEMSERLEISRSELRKSEENLSVTLRSIGDAVIATNAEALVITMNPVAEQLTGWKEHAAQDINITEIFHIVSEATGAEIENPVVSVLREGTVTGAANNTILIAKSGTRIPVDYNCSPMKSEKGNCVGFVLIFKDVSAKRESERSLIEATRAAEAANTSKSAFLANMSHELRTPLNAIIGFSEVLIDKHFGDLNEAQEEYANDILSSGRHLLSLVQDILDISKVEAGRMELELSKFSLNDLLTGSLTMVKEKAMKHGIELSVETEDISGSIIADERKIKQVVFNLLSNAVKFTPDGGDIHVRSEGIDSQWLRDHVPAEFREEILVKTEDTHSAYIKVSVADNGKGIKSESLKEIFNPFQQEDASTARQYGGTGLGLSLTKKMLELHRGGIWAESRIGKGSTFTFVIPLRESANILSGDAVGKYSDKVIT